jgi:integrase
MASIGRDPNGGKRILFVDDDGTRRTIRLGKMSIKLAETVKHHVETMLACRRAGVPLPPATATWLSSIDEVLHERLAKAGLVPRRQNETLGKFLADWLQSRSHYKATSRDAWSRSINDLIGFFGSDTPLRKIGRDEAQAFRRHLIDRGLRDTTIHKRLQHVKLFFRDAVRQGRLDANPFEYVTHRAGRPEERRLYVSTETVEKVVRQCPNATWRLLLILARYAGLRTPSEPFALRWRDILWDEDRFIVDSPKTGPRAVPLFPRVRQALAEAFELAPEGAEFVIPEDMRRRAMGPHGLHNTNLRTTLEKLIKRAGLKPWPRLWHNLRASCETDLVQRYPLPVVAKWLGNTSVIAMRHYVDVTDEVFRQAAQRGTESGTLLAHFAAQRREATKSKDGNDST